MFPANNVWNTRIDSLPVDPHSASYINNISASAALRYDITIPVNVVPGTQPLVPISITDGAAESDPGPYPIPPNPLIEDGSDQHILVVDKDHCTLYELFYAIPQGNGGWQAYSASKWSLLSNDLRPSGWTSGDAAGLPMTPGILRYDEVASGQVNHALRFTAPRTQRLFIWPARHYASSITDPNYPPMGQRFRLKAGFDISSYSPRMQVILRTMQQYGVILADNGLAWEMQFELDSRWDRSELDVLRTIAGANLEAVDESSLMVNPDTAEAVQPSAVSTVTVTPRSQTLGASGTLPFSAFVTGSKLGVTWSISPQVGTINAAGLYTAPSVVASSQDVTVTATLSDNSASGTATVTLQAAAQPTLVSASVSPGTVVGGNNVSLTVVLTAAAPANGATVSLTGSNPAFPNTTVTVPASSALQTFSVPTAPVTATTSVSITASYNGSSVTASPALIVTPASLPQLASLVLTPSTVTGGSNFGLTVNLDAPAVSTTNVMLTSSHPSIVASLPLTLATGNSNGIFTFPAAAVSAVTQVTLTASLNGVSVSSVLTVNPAGGSSQPKVTSLVLTPSTVTGGSNFGLTVNLDAPAVSTTNVMLTSSHPSIVASLPLTINNGNSNGTFTLPAAAVSAATQVTLTASLNGISVSSVLTVNPAAGGGGGSSSQPRVTSLVLTPSTVTGGSNFGLTVNLDAPAVSTTNVILTSSNPSIVASLPITIAIGNSNGIFTFPAAAVSAATQVTLTASLNGVSVSSVLTVNPAGGGSSSQPKVTSLVLTPSTVTGGSNFSLTVNLDAPAASTTDVMLTSSNPSIVASLPLTIAIGNSNGIFTFPAAAVGAATQVTLTASLNGVSVSSVLTVNPAGGGSSSQPRVTSLVLTPSSVTGGSYFGLTVNLDAPAVSTTNVMLTSSHPSIVASIPLTIAIGNSNGIFTFPAAAVGAATQVTLTASLNGISVSSVLTVHP